MSFNRPNPTDEIIVNGVPFSHEDMFNVVDDFYTRVQSDPLLQIPFQSVHDWPEHIDRITHFWWIRLGGEPYSFAEYNPVQKHFFAGFNSTFLSRWLELFHETLKTHLREDQIQLWTLITQRMGQALSMKNEYFKQHFEEQQRSLGKAESQKTQL